MNLTDRSVIAIDLAIQRRFHFIPFEITQEPVASLLQRWTQKNYPSLTKDIIEIIKIGNSLLVPINKSLLIGPANFITDKKLTPTDYKEFFLFNWNQMVLRLINSGYLDDNDPLKERLLKLPLTYFQVISKK